MLKRVVQLRGADAMLGAERVVLETAKQSPAFGYEPVILALHDPAAPEPLLLTLAREAGIRAEALPCHGRFDPGVFARLRRFINNERISLLHSHGYKENFYALFCGAKVPLVATNHLWKRTSRPLKFYCWLDSKLIKRFDHVIAVSEEIRRELYAAGVPPRRLSKIPNGIDPLPFQLASRSADRQRLRDSLDIPPGRFAVGMVSSLSPEKGHIYAFKAIARLRARFPEIMLIVAGDGALRPRLQDAVEQLDLAGHVRFIGRRNDVAAILAAFDVFLLPSLAEGLPMALLEAMAAGRAVVASRVGDVPVAVHDGKTGLLTPAGDATALAAALVELIANPGLRSRLGHAAADLIEREFSSRRMARECCLLYDGLQQQPASPANNRTRRSGKRYSSAVEKQHGTR